MQCSESLVHAYPPDEQNLFYENQKLQDALLSCFKEIETPEEKKWTDSFVTDGFYPYYTKQKLKILYIGKDDDGNVVGVKNAKKLSEDIPNKIKF